VKHRASGRHRCRPSTRRHFLWEVAAGAALAGLMMPPHTTVVASPPSTARAIYAEHASLPWTTSTTPTPVPTARNVRAQHITPPRKLFVNGRQGLRPLTQKALTWVEYHVPEVTVVGGVRPDQLHWHPNGLALDLMVDSLEEGDRVYAKLLAARPTLKWNYMLWRVPKHYDHIHVNFPWS